MTDENKTKEQLIQELEEMRQQTSKLELLEAERKQTERKLSRYHERLEELVKERTAKLETANKQLQQEITERKQAEEALRESQEHFRALAENSSDIIQIVDSEGFIRYLSPSVQRILGYKPEELIGRQSIEVVHPDDLPRVAEGFEKTIQEPDVPVTVECRCRHKDGSWRVIEGRGINRFDNPFVKGFISNMHDITERKQAEEQAREAEALKELDRMRTELLSNVSHELRTPLATVKGYSTMLLDYDRRLRHDEKRKYLRFIDKASDRLVELIDQLLDMSRLEAGLVEIKKEPTSISSLIKEVVAETQVRKPRRQLVMNLPKRLPRLNIDARRIRQVVENLIDNAIKYSGEETEVVVSARQVRRRIVVSVTDQGIGIPGDDLPRVFDRIYRTRQRKVIEVGGAGLGLSICQKLVEAHKGRIWIESEEGKGTTVFFTLPVAVTKKGGQCKKA